MSKNKSKKVNHFGESFKKINGIFLPDKPKDDKSSMDITHIDPVFNMPWGKLFNDFEKTLNGSDEDKSTHGDNENKDDSCTGILPGKLVDVTRAPNANGRIYPSIVGTDVQSMYPQTFSMRCGYEPYAPLDDSESKDDPTKKIPTPMEIKQKLDQHVIGQEDAKIALSVAAYNHYKRLEVNDSDDDIEIQKSNVLLIGKSGTGKTLLVETLSKILDVPFVVADATEFTPSGIHGKDVSTIIESLVEMSDKDIDDDKFNGIVFIDEFDKISGSSGVDGIARKGILASDTQSAFLKLLEGKDVTIKTGGGFFGSREKVINTKNILFICGGAFSGIEKIVSKIDGNTLGFNSDFSKQEVVSRKVESKDIIEYGMTPELVGRIPVIVELQSLDKYDMINIMTKPKNALLKQYWKMFNINDIELEFTDDALEAIADKAISSQIGARSLRSILEPIMNKLMFNVMSDGNVVHCVINSNVILHEGMPELVHREEKQYAL